MNIGIIGAGTVGATLGKAFIRAGHSVMFSSRTPDSAKMQELARETGAPIGTVSDTVHWGEVVVIALNWNAVAEALSESTEWAGKVIIDCTNRFGAPPANTAGSAAQDLAVMSGGRVVKAFNTIGAEHYLDPVFNGHHATMLIAGDDAEAKQITAQLAADIGFDPIDAGSLSASALLENMAALWVHLAVRTGLGRRFAFKIVQQP